MSEVLVLDQGYQPHRIVSWQRAVTMLFAGKVEVVEEYEEDIRSVSLTIKMPAVVRLLRNMAGRNMAVRFSRINVLSRDGFRCQYCGRRLPPPELSFDHVMPRSRGGRTAWDNITTCCYPCNKRKGDRTPEEAGMRLRSRPRRPRSLPFLTMRFRTTSVPDAWRSWCYWQGALVGSP